MKFCYGMISGHSIVASMTARAFISCVCFVLSGYKTSTDQGPIKSTWEVSQGAVLSLLLRGIVRYWRVAVPLTIGAVVYKIFDEISPVGPSKMLAYGVNHAGGPG